jgi:copper chaperone
MSQADRGVRNLRETFSVPEVSCAHCKSSIEGALRPLAGVSEANVRIDDKQVDVAYDPNATSREEVLAAITDAGYEVAV